MINLIYNQDNKFKLYSGAGKVVQGNDLIVTIQNLPSNASTVAWSWTQRVIPAVANGIIDYDNGTTIQGDTGTGDNATVVFDVTDTTNIKATVTMPLPLVNAEYNKGESFSLVFKSDITDGIQKVFKVGDVNASGGGSPINPPTPYVAGEVLVANGTQSAITYSGFVWDGTESRLGVGITPARTLHINDVMRLEPSSTPSSPSAGDVYYDSGTNKLRIYNGTGWDNLN